MRSWPGSRGGASGSCTMAFGLRATALITNGCTGCIAHEFEFAAPNQTPPSAAARQPLAAPAGLNEIWALDFMADKLYGGRQFRTFNVIDKGNREVLGIEVATSIPSLRVIRVMQQL